MQKPLAWCLGFLHSLPFTHPRLKPSWRPLSYMPKEKKELTISWMHDPSIEEAKLHEFGGRICLPRGEDEEREWWTRWWGMPMELGEPWNPWECPSLMMERRRRRIRESVEKRIDKMRWRERGFKGCRGSFRVIANKASLLLSGLGEFTSTWAFKQMESWLGYGPPNHDGPHIWNVMHELNCPMHPFTLISKIAGA